MVGEIVTGIFRWAGHRRRDREARAVRRTLELALEDRRPRRRAVGGDGGPERVIDLAAIERDHDLRSPLFPPAGDRDNG